MKIEFLGGPEDGLVIKVSTTPAPTLRFPIINAHGFLNAQTNAIAIYDLDTEANKYQYRETVKLPITQ